MLSFLLSFYLQLSIKMKATFFETPEDFRTWFEGNHTTETELLVGFYKKATKLKSINWSESVDQALCYGWIDGIRRRIDDQAYSIRFTPRKKRSHWSNVNIKKVAELIEKGLMKPEGLAAFERMDDKNAGQAAFEQKGAIELSEAFLNQIKANEKAWDYYQNKLTPYSRKGTNHWVMSAKQESTRERRMKILIESCLEGRKIPMYRKKGE